MRKNKKQKSVDPDTVWVPAGQTVTVAGKKIPGGMIYVGNYLQAEDYYSSSKIDPALINPKLRVRWSTPDYSAVLMGYRPSYSDMHSTCRADYLNWLISGRKDPTCNIGYVFLFFYGLERRFYVDSKTSITAQKERQAIIDEVKRLLSIYKSSNSFNSYANQLLEADYVKQNFKSYYDYKPPDDPKATGLTMPLILGLGQFVSESKPIPPDWAYAWVMLDPETRLKKHATICKKEFKPLFQIHYTKKFNKGMLIKPGNTKLQVKYRPASSGIRDIKIPCGNLIDVTKLKAPIKQLNIIVENCTNALEPLSRFLIKNPEKADSIQSLLLMPKELMKKTELPKAKKINKAIDSILGDQQEKFINNAKLIELWPDDNNDSLTKKELKQFAQLLEKFGIGIEPDPRFIGIPFNIQKKTVLFRLPKNTPNIIFKEYKKATIILHLASIVSWADGTVSHSERLFLEKYLEKASDISLSEKFRLQAHLRWLLKEPPNMVGVKKRIELLTNKDKKSTAAFCIGVASADGHIDPPEIKALTKIYSVLGFKTDDVYTDIHSMMSTSYVSPADGPVSVQKDRKSTGGYKIPSKPTISEMKSKGVALDMTIVQRKLKETAKVSKILGEIFEEDTVEEIVPIPEKQTIDTKIIGSLDVEHSELFNQLIKQTEWRREDFEALAEKNNLLPDGALDMINEAAYEICDEPLIDGDDPILVDMDVAKEMII